MRDKIGEVIEEVIQEAVQENLEKAIDEAISETDWDDKLKDTIDKAVDDALDNMDWDDTFDDYMRGFEIDANKVNGLNDTIQEELAEVEINASQVCGLAGMINEALDERDLPASLEQMFDDKLAEQVGKKVQEYINQNMMMPATSVLHLEDVVGRRVDEYLKHRSFASEVLAAMKSSHSEEGYEIRELVEKMTNIQVEFYLRSHLEKLENYQRSIHERLATVEALLARTSQAKPSPKPSLWARFWKWISS